MRSWLFGLAEEQSKTYSEIKTLLQEIPSNTRFQNTMFQKVYLGQNGNKESVRLVMANLCGSFSLGNRIADEVCNNYAKDQTINKIIQKERGRKINLQNSQKNEEPQLKTIEQHEGDDQSQEKRSNRNLLTNKEHKW